MRTGTKAWAAALALAGAAVGAPATSATAAAQSAVAAAAQPDIVVIVTDDQPLGRLDAMPQVRTLLRDRGVDFRYATAPTALCAPSRAALLTGRRASDTGIFTNGGPSGGWVGFSSSGLEARTLPVWLDAAGYRTALVGKYLNSFGRSDPGYLPPGWDTFTSRVAGSNYYNYTLRTGRAGGPTFERSYGDAEADYSTDVYAAEAVRQVQQTPVGQPLFLYFAPMAPHAPFQAPPRYKGTWPVDPKTPDFNEWDVSDKPRWVQRQTKQPPLRMRMDAARQHEMVMAVDDAVAAIVAALGDRASNTLFVFTSDNGIMLGSHRLTSKGMAYARSLRVPLILRWDGRLPAGRVDERMAETVDLTATVLDAAGLRRSTSGVSLLDQQRRTGTVVEAAPGPDMGRPAFCGWRTQRWLYVQYAHHAGRELYDYRTDPFELHNLAYDPAHRAQLRLMRSQAEAACSPVPPGFSW